MILVDTSVLVSALTGARVRGPDVRRTVASGERLGLSAIVLYEWLRGTRSEAEIAAQEALLPSQSAWPFGPPEAALAASLYRHLPRSRQRQTDLAIAAAALIRRAPLWTENPRDFADIPDLVLYDA